ncbi:MAG: hypothetical protein N3D20_02665 [Candidatus Pacearchaeota archaeon]|nr:hypothetical protein [Candidatus Pacearchaeota archaeon]
MEKEALVESNNKRFISDEEEILREAEVSLLLSNYDDIFSDFDPRPYSQRALSIDFLDEARRATRELKDGSFQLRLLLPIGERKVEREILIKKRLREHFKKHKEMLEKERKKIMINGFLFVIFGILFMFIASYILFYHGSKVFWFEFLVVLLEPGGWFLFWEGLDLVIFETKKISPELMFYRKMSKAEIVFSHYK